MEETDRIIIDPNTASLEELTQLPGVGATMAERIISQRPFLVVEDLMRVSGISTDRLERLRPMLALSSPAPAIELEERLPKEEEEIKAAEPIGETFLPIDEETDLQGALEALAPEGVEEAEAVEASTEPAMTRTLLVEEPDEDADKDVEAGLSEEEKKAPKKEPAPRHAPAPGWVSRSQAGWMAFGSAILAVIISLLLTLGILASLNNGRLTYASPAHVNQLSVRIDGLEVQVAALATEQEGLRARVTNLEALAGRVSALEKTAEQLNTTMKQTQTQVDQLSGELQKLTTSIQGMKAQIERFTAFFNGLRDLINQTIPKEIKP